MNPIDINFKMPRDAFAVKNTGSKFYISDINGFDFNHAEWSKLTRGMSQHMTGEARSYDPRIAFETRKEALLQAQIARIEYAEHKIFAMRGKKAINREQYIDARSRLRLISEAAKKEGLLN